MKCTQNSHIHHSKSLLPLPKAHQCSYLWKTPHSLPRCSPRYVRWHSYNWNPLKGYLYTWCLWEKIHRWKLCAFGMYPRNLTFSYNFGRQMVRMPVIRKSIRMWAFSSNLIEKGRSSGFYEMIDYCPRIARLIEYYLCQFALQRVLKGFLDK